MNERTAPSTGGADMLDKLASIAGDDRRARRRLVAVEADARRAEADVRVQQARAVADADAAVRHAEATVRVESARRQAEAEMSAARAERRDAARAALTARLAAARAAAPTLFASAVYLVTAGAALAGQASVATAHWGWPLWRACALALFVEGLALAMALTSASLRRQGRSAFAPRALTWVCALAAAALNAWGHWEQDPQLAALLAFASLAAITLWEVRSAAAEPESPRRFGLARWVRYPRNTFAAWSVSVRDQVSPEAAALIARANAERDGAQPVRVLALPSAPAPVVKSASAHTTKVASARVEERAAAQGSGARKVVRETGRALGEGLPALPTTERGAAMWAAALSALLETGELPNGRELAEQVGAHPASGRRVLADLRPLATRRDLVSDVLALLQEFNTRRDATTSDDQAMWTQALGALQDANSATESSDVALSRRTATTAPDQGSETTWRSA